MFEMLYYTETEDEEWIGALKSCVACRRLIGRILALAGDSEYCFDSRER